MERKWKTYTSADWQRIYPSPRVMDPDGWDRKDMHQSWYRELITQEEYMKRVSQSTCKYPISAYDVFTNKFTWVFATHG